jgi:signal transduction histidine kinase/CheY-like chemotaxis protein
MQVTQADPALPVTDATRSALDHVHRLLTLSPADQPTLDVLLQQLAQAFGAEGAGLAALAGGTPKPRGRVLGELPADAPWPWDLDPGLPGRLAPAAPAVAVARPAGGAVLVAAVAAGPIGYLLWIEDDKKSDWSPGEAAVLALAGEVVGRRLTDPLRSMPRWADQVDRVGRQQCMEITAHVTRRLAHDFGNVLTGILGFSELSLAQQVPADTPLSTYVAEVHRAAQNGAQFTHQLRLFSRRRVSAQASTLLAPFLAEEERRIHSVWGHAVSFQVRIETDLPAAAVDPEQLRPALAALLENAREAAAGSNQGTVTLTVRPVELTIADCLDLYGDPSPGPYLEIDVTDNGTGLSPEAERRLFAEPFFSTKPRRRGFGLSLAYGVVTAHRGGLRVQRARERGTCVRVLLPVAAAAPTAPPRLNGKLRGEKVLVVDDDPLILQFVCTTLERAGYRIQGAASAEEALKSYAAAGPDPFNLVLSDVIMPKVSGVDLARQLVSRDANVRVLFMSGQVPGDAIDSTIAGHQFDMLAKPFRPDGLLKAVRTALDRTGQHGPARAGGGGPVASTK